MHGHFLTVLWCFTRLFIPSSSGRKRFNVLGALHATTQQLITITNTTTINAQSVCALLDKLRAAHQDTLSITLVLDNARYQRAHIVQDYAKALGIKLLFLPSYSPNLNLIERLWKLTKRDCLYGKYYDTFEKFKEAILHSLEQPSYELMVKRKSLLSLKLQLFKNVQFLAT